MTSLPSDEGKYSSVHRAPSGTRGLSAWLTGWPGVGMVAARAERGADSTVAATHVAVAMAKMVTARVRGMGVTLGRSSLT